MRKYWLALAFVVAVAFAVLGWTGVRIYQSAPPIPERVVTTEGREVIGRGQIAAGQNVWQALGGMEMGSVWGHGSYVAPDWTADWLHREALFVLDTWSRAEHAVRWDDLDEERRAGLSRRLTDRMRRSGYDPATGVLTIEPVRAAALEANVRYYSEVFANGRDEYAIPRGTLNDPAKARAMATFFFWSAWAAVARRPNELVSYTNNWPHEPLVANRPTGNIVVWSGVSILMLLGGIGAMATWRAVRRRMDDESAIEPPASDPLLHAIATPSQQAMMKFFWLTAALFLLQILMGVVVAHYGVEGSGFYGIALAKYLPHTVARTWHLQIGIFWIATAWLATGLYVGPAVGHEPRFQRLGVNVLFVALVVVALGSLAGEWLSVKGYLGDAWFLFGHSGYEYIDLGRVWQIGLATGLVLWFILVARAVMPALRRRDEQRPLLTLFVLSSGAIAGFYFAALRYGKHSNLAIAEYWRWWVVHLWVEGFFEVFATVVIAFLFARLGLVAMRSAGRSAVLSATIFLSGGIIGTLHHLYFSGTPTFVIALGSVFSALEVVPLVFVGFEAWENL
jgi:nitric oxide reductase subunit B